MIYQFYNTTQPESPRRSKRLENASFICGIIAIATPCIVYPAFICGALAIVFALLSRGGEQTMTSRAKIGLSLGAIGFCIVLLMLLWTLVVAYVYYGGFWEMARDIYSNMGLDFDALMQSYYN